MKLSTIELSQERFEPFGRVLEPFAEEAPEVAETGIFDFFVIFKEFAEGWQIGYLKQTGKVIKQLECHPNTPEVFVPLRGKAVLLLANNSEEEEGITAFKLDKPIVLRRGVWHGVISLSDRSEILIIENPDVIDKFYKLEGTISDQSLIKP